MGARAEIEQYRVEIEQCRANGCEYRGGLSCKSCKVVKLSSCPDRTHSMAESEVDMEVQILWYTSFAKLTVVQLKEKLKQRGLKVSGTKHELIARLMENMCQRSEEDETDKYELLHEEDASSESTDDDERPICKNKSQAARKEREATGEEEERKVHIKEACSLLTFRDVEETMPTFSGDDETDVTKWIPDFEETATSYNWSDIQKVVYAKRLLRGSAKLFVNYERNTKTWTSLKTALITEFADLVDSRAVHKKLAEKRKSPKESLQSYMYAMLEIAKQADVDMPSVIQYIIDGIQDDAITKTILYGAKTLSELKKNSSNTKP